jgi:hypothetical protein
MEMLTDAARAALKRGNGGLRRTGARDACRNNLSEKPL